MSIHSLLRQTFSALLLLGLATGCGTKPAPAPAEHHEGDGHDHAHEHPSEGPHHGQLIELGEEEYHAELIHDDATHTVTIYLLDSKGKDSVPVAETEITLNLVAGGTPAQFKLPAVPQSTDPSGRASKFELSNEQMCTALDDEKSKGRLNVTIEGKPFSGAIEHHEHGDHEHEKPAAK